AVPALGALLGRVPLLVADEHDPVVAQAGEAAAQGPVVADGPVAVQLDELVEDQLDVVHRLRPVVVARDLDRLPGSEVAVDLLLEADQVAPHAAALLAAAGLAAGAGLQPGQRLLHHRDFRLERQPLWGHRHLLPGQKRNATRAGGPKPTRDQPTRQAPDDRAAAQRSP